MKLPENTGINEYTIKLIEGKQPIHGLIHVPSLVELKILKAYIKTYLKIGFIWLSKSLVDAFILFDKKPNRSFWLSVDYQSLNNLTIED